MSYLYDSCPIEPWLAEIVLRMHEAFNAGTNVVNLSYTHPRGFIPNQIIRRPAVQKTLAGWVVNSEKLPPDQYPMNFFMPRGARPENLEYCSTTAFEKEISKREEEAVASAKAVLVPDGFSKLCPVIDLTNFHPRGGIPGTILARLARRKSKAWQDEAREQIAKLQAEANKAEAFAQTQRDRADGIASKGGDPTPLLTAAQRELEKAASAREQAKLIKTEMGEAA